MKIVTGGQTGVDRAALDAAISAGVPVGGWCPAGRRAEDGPIPSRYNMTETTSTGYTQRTDLNVRDSDATLVLTPGEPTGGTACTLSCALKRDKPVCIVDPFNPDEMTGLVRWTRANSVAVLNVAGPRESGVPGIYDVALKFVAAYVHELQQCIGQPAQ